MVTSGCVRATAVDAFNLNYSVMLPEECVADRGQVSHKVSLFDMHAKYADVLPWEQVTNYLNGLGEPVVERQCVFDGDAHRGASVADDAALVRDQRVHEVQPTAELHHHEHRVSAQFRRHRQPPLGELVLGRRHDQLHHASDAGLRLVARAVAEGERPLALREVDERRARLRAGLQRAAQI
ncbi:MAG: isochorismatase family protein, partial [SAR324 cluster bacterium]|nr:isochorismatase family protein [SAR324 cluster bacterium]